MKFFKATPILRINDKPKALEFYIDYLEFKIDWEYQQGEESQLYMQISKGECLIHLSEHRDDLAVGSIIRIPTEALVENHKLLSVKNYETVLPKIKLQPWNSMDFIAIDPFQNSFIFFENTDEA